jgi:hypothetical protein
MTNPSVGQPKPSVTGRLNSNIATSFVKNAYNIKVDYGHAKDPCYHTWKLNLCRYKLWVMRPTKAIIRINEMIGR